MVKAVFKFLLENLSHLFGLIGLVLTVYFGVFYVPDWLEEAKNANLKNAETALIQSIKELIFSDSTVSSSDIDILMNAQEISLGQRFPLTKKQILTVTQQSFMNDKFLPLQVRRNLIEEIEQIKNVKIDSSKIFPQPKKYSKSKSDSSLDILGIIFPILSILLGLGGIIDIFLRSRKKELKKKVEPSFTGKRNDTIFKEFEIDCFRVLSQIVGTDLLLQGLRGPFMFDGVLNIGDKKLYLELRINTDVSQSWNWIKRFHSDVVGSKGTGCIISNTPLGPWGLRHLRDINNLAGNKIFFVHYTSDEDLRKQMEKLLSEEFGWNNR